MWFDTEKWHEIFSTLGRHKLRTALTAFGVFWGIFMLTLLLGAGNGLKNGVVEDFKEVPPAVWVWSKSPTQIPYQGMSVGREVRLRPEDGEGISNNVGSVAKVYSQNSLGIWGGSPAYTVYKNNSGSFQIQGAHAGMSNIYQQKIILGRYFNELDDDKRRKVAVIGDKVKTQLFKMGENPIGAYIEMSGINFQVIGVYKTNNADQDPTAEEKVYVPNDTLRYAFNQRGWVGSFVIIPKPGIHASIAEADVKAYLMKKNKVDPNDLGVLGSFNLQNEFDKINGLFFGITVFSWFVAVGTIIAGAIGVGNIMLIVVKERTREIGLRKAMGATPQNITAMIMQESMFLTAIAGYLGLVIGVALLELVNLAMSANGGKAGMFKSPQVDFNTAVTAVVVLCVAGIAASFMPASKAAKVNPIVALQDE